MVRRASTNERQLSNRSLFDLGVHRLEDKRC